MTVSLLQNYEHKTKSSARPGLEAALYKLDETLGSSEEVWAQGLWSRWSAILLKKKKWRSLAKEADYKTAYAAWSRLG